jgi:hypothetical protein
VIVLYSVNQYKYLKTVQYPIQNIKQHKGTEKRYNCTVQIQKINIHIYGPTLSFMIFNFMTTVMTGGTYAT